VADTELLQFINNAVLSTTARRLSRDVTQGTVHLPGNMTYLAATSNLELLCSQEG